MRKIVFAFGLLAMLQLPIAAHAYIGPGAGAGMIAIVLGILSSIFLAFVGILWYPIKRLIKAWKASARSSADSTRKVEDTSSGSEPASTARESRTAGDHSLSRS
jgi:hypothetical protein